MSDTRKPLVDELLTLHAKLKAVAGEVKRYDTLRKQVRAWALADKVDPANEVSYAGTRGSVVLGPQENEREWIEGANIRLYHEMGTDRFLGIANVTFKAAEEMLGDVTNLVTQERTGSRSITIVNAPAPAAKGKKK